MKTKIYSAAAFVVLISFLTGFAMIRSSQVKHIVVFKYKEGTDAKKIEEINTAFKALKGKIPGIVSFEYGVNNSPEGLNKGFTHIYLVTFDNAKSRDAYLPHPEHKKFTDLLGKSGILEEPFVVDFQVSE